MEYMKLQVTLCDERISSARKRFVERFEIMTDLASIQLCAIRDTSFQDG